MEDEAGKLMKLKKVSSRLGINPLELDEMDSQVTLSNDHAAHVKYEESANRMLTDEESKARAASFLQRAWDNEALQGN